MGWWKADPAPPEPSAPPKAPISRPPPQASAEPASECPVDPRTREIWLQQAKKSSQQHQLPLSHPPISAASKAFAATPSTECSSDRIDQSPSTPLQPSTIPPALTRSLSHDRAVSSIPRASDHPTTSTLPANSETETGPHSSGNWIYPSEAQFFNAVLRKHNPSALAPAPSPSNPNADPTASLASTMPTIIPIHNAVNERAWSLIRSWEANTSAACGGPKLASFKGLGAGALSPKARWNSLLGYTPPFDRHDWVVERCDGSRVEYLIDFYQGKEEAGKPGAINFYLDVRPKLNSVEGMRMRAERVLGMR